MLCEVCQKREALVHLTRISHTETAEQLWGPSREHHFCQECADAYFARSPGMNASRDLICLSDWYRSKLYDLLEAAHPEAFDNSDTEACRRGSALMRVFLRAHLTNDGVELNEDGFQMLCSDFFGSHHFYERVDKRKRTDTN